MLDHSYGIVPLFVQDNSYYTLLVKLASGRHRSLPKGHSDPGETSYQTAIRELYEETGLTVSEEHIDKNHVYTENYSFIHPRKGPIDKRVEYYVASLPYPRDLPSGPDEGSEILDKRILPFDEAIALVTYDATRQVLENIKQNISI